MILKDVVPHLLHYSFRHPGTGHINLSNSAGGGGGGGGGAVWSTISVELQSSP